MLKEILEQTKLIQIVKEEEQGPVRIAYGHAMNLREWLVFVRLIYTQQPGDQCSVSRLYGLQGGKLASVWRIEARDPMVLKEIARGYVSKPEWLKNFRTEQLADGVRTMTLIGDPPKMADPRDHGLT